MKEYELIQSKIVEHSEIVVCLFDLCNLSCVFCPQQHDSAVGASQQEILAKAPLIADWINNQSKSNIVKLHIMGGEVFQDQLVQKGFISFYQSFMDELIRSVRSDAQLVFNFVTNLVFNHSDQVLEFLRQNHLKVSISYDARGRFREQDKKIFLKNLESFADRIEMVSLVMTKQNMKAVMEGDETFDLLYEKYVCDWDQLLPSFRNAEDYLPSESESLNFYKHLVDHYPRCLNVKNFLSPKIDQKMTCTRGNSLTVMSDGSIPRGCSGAVFLKEGLTQDLGSEKVVENFLEKYNCLQCQFYSKCPFTCFIKNDYKHIKRDLDKCVFKSVFEYVQSKS